MIRFTDFEKWSLKLRLGKMTELNIGWILPKMKVLNVNFKKKMICKNIICRTQQFQPD